MPTSRGKRGMPAPAGEDAHFDFGESDLRFGAVGSQPIIHGQRDLRAASHALTVDQRHRRKGKIADAVEDLVSGSDALGSLFGRGSGQSSQFLQIGAGDKLSRCAFAALEQQPAQVGSLFETGDKFSQFHEHRLRKRVHFLIGHVERQQADAPGQFLEAKHFCGNMAKIFALWNCPSMLTLDVADQKVNTFRSRCSSGTG